MPFPAPMLLRTFITIIVKIAEIMCGLFYIHLFDEIKFRHVETPNDMW